jgi:hypothetical protein
VFDILANGVTEVASYDPVKAAGGDLKATQFTFDVAASGGAGLNLALQAITGTPFLSGIQISRVNPAPSTWTASVEVSYAGGAAGTWTTIASGLPLDTFGAGSFAFTPTQATTDGLLQIVATDGTQTVVDQSLGAFTSVPATTEFYIATPANGGSDANNGTSASTPMADLATLLNVYALQPGDVVNIGPGTYTLPSTINLGAAASGAAGDPVVITGAGASTIFQGVTTGSGTLPPIFQFDGGHDITLEDMTLSGGGTAVNVVANSGSVDVTLKSLEISGFVSDGVDVGQGATNFALIGGEISAPTDAGNTYGLSIAYAQGATVTGATFSGVTYGVDFEDVLSIDVTGDTFTGNYIGINSNYTPASTTSVEIDDNIVTGATEAGISVSLPFVGGGLAFVEGNTVSGTKGVGVSVNGPVLVEGNTVTGVVNGIVAQNQAFVTGNTVSGISDDAVEIGYGGGSATLNTILDSGTGLYLDWTNALATNNLIYGSVAYGANIVDPSTLDNNTFVQTGGVAVLIATNAAVNVENDIFDQTGGVVYVVPAADQGGLYANYNLFDLRGGAMMANWAGATTTAQGLTVASFDDWMFGTGEDRDSEAGAPTFANPSDPTPVWNDFVLQPGSVGIAAGDPTSRYDEEPADNGGRITIGLEGDTPYAKPSAAATVDVTSPAPLTKLQDGVTTTITFGTSGVSGLQAIARVNLAGSAIAGTTASNTWTVGSSSYGVTTTTSAINTAGVLDGAPAQVYQRALYGDGGVGATLTQSVAVANGTYLVTLNFATYSDYASTDRIFNIVINGVTVATDFNIFAAAGNQNDVAVDQQFTVTASGGSGVVVQLVSQSASYGAMISGIEIDRPTASVAGATALVQVSPDGGLNWTTVAAAAPIDAWGNGSLAWTPNFITNGNTALVMVTVNGVSAQSQSFLVANAGNDYYINGASTADAQYASAAGNDLNSGKTPNAPMADLAALLRAYTLLPGDVVFIDSGSYTLLTDALLGPADSGASGDPITFQGPTDGGVATLNRANSLYGNVFQIDGASQIDIDNLTLTGGNIGVDVVDSTSSAAISADDVVITNENSYGIYFGVGDTGLSLTGSQIYGGYDGNRNTGVYAVGSSEAPDNITITGDKIFGQYTGIYAEFETGLVSDDSLYQNADYGLQFQGFSSGTNRLVISNNQVFDNGDSSTDNYGVWVGGVALVAGNAIYGQTASGDVGLLLGDGAVAAGNTIYNNYIGLDNSDGTPTVTGNRIFTNSYAGVEFGYYGGTLLDDQIYSNGVGVLDNEDYYGTAVIENDLIYQNSSYAVELTGGSDQIVNDTIWQPTGTSIALTSQTTSLVANDIIWTDSGTLLNISADSVAGFQALYNLYYEGAAATPATLVDYGGTIYANLAAWRTGLGAAAVTSVNGVLAQNAGSIEGNPAFVDPAGADGVLGGPDTPLGGGKDDNFAPSKTSPAIDAGDAYLAPGADMLGQARSDDPSIPNTGSGPPAYDVSTLTAMTPPAGTPATLISGSNTYAGYYATYTLPFSFSLYGIAYSTVYVSPSGALFFSTTAAQNAAFVTAPSASALATTPMIAAFWSGAFDTRYYGTDGVYATKSTVGDVNYVTFSYAVTPTGGNSSTPAGTFAVTLGSDGSIQFDYGANLNGIAAVIGVSGGEPGLTSVAAISGLTNLSGAPAILFAPDPAKGLTYDDIGAVEFEGSSSDNTLPTVVGTTNLPADGASTDAVFTSIALQFSGPLNVISAVSAANYQLVDIAGGADATIAVTPVYSSATDSVTLLLPGGPLANGEYQLTVSGANELLDASGNPLNGAKDTTDTASPFVSKFTIDRSAIQPPVTSNLDETTPSDQSLAVTLQATDPQGLALIYAITQAPQHGAVEDFNAATGTFTYVPDVGYVGADAIVYSATDSELASAPGDVDINVTAYRTAPIAYAASASAIATRPTTITLQGYDANTAVANLTLSIVTQPKHGVATVTGQDTVSYTATAGYVGSDAFSYEWLDETASPTIASTPATVSLLVTTVNEAPTTSATTISALENQPYTFTLANFPYADPNNTPPTALKSVLIATLPGSGVLSDNNVPLTAGSLVSAADITAGELVYTPATNAFGAGVASFSFAVENSGGTADGGEDTSGAATATIDVGQVNMAPTTSSFAAQAYENEALALTSSLFPFTDPNVPPETMAGIVLTSLPTAGTLTLSAGAGAVTAPLNQLITKAQLDAGDLVFTPAASAVGASYASFGFEAVDTGPATNGGQNTSLPATLKINVAAVNQAPQTANASATGYMNVPYTFSTANFPYSDSNNSPSTALKAVIVVTLPQTGALTDAGVAVTAGQAISAADIASGEFVYTPAGNAVGTDAAGFGFEVENSGGAAHGGVDTSAQATFALNIQQRQPGVNGTYSITFLGAAGAGYATDTITYSSTGVKLSVAYSNGLNATYSYNADGSLHDVNYTSAKGEPYTSYDIFYNASRKIVSISYSDGVTATYTDNADGTLHDIDYTGITGEVYTSYDAVYVNGTLHDVNYTGIAGRSYKSFDIVYGPNRKIESVSYSDGLTATYTYNAGGSFQIAYTGVSGTIDGRSYSSFVMEFNASDVKQQTIYYNSSGQTVATVTYTDGGDPVITLDAYDEPAPDQPDAIVAAAAPEEAPLPLVQQQAIQVADGRRYDDWLLYGAAKLDVPTASIGGALGPAPSRKDLADALLLAGIALPLAVRGLAAVTPKRKATLSIFDPSTDRFERIDEGEEAWELPFAGHGDQGDEDFDFL